MNFEVVIANCDHVQPWLFLRDLLYSGAESAFHKEEQEIILTADDKDCFLVVAEKGSVCGMLEVSLRNVVDGCLSSPVGYMEGIYVCPEYRGHGIARKLVSAAEAWSRDKGCREMGSDSELHNESAHRFHEHMGFEETYRVVGYRKDLDK